MDNVEFRPASKTPTYINPQVFATIVNLIPHGKIVVYDELLTYLAKRSNADYCEINGVLPFSKSFLYKPADVARVDFITELVENVPDDDRIPYWRLIGNRGLLIDFGRYSSKESQKQYLELEGHTVIQPNPDIRRYKLVDYQNSLFDLDRLIIND